LTATLCNISATPLHAQPSLFPKLPQTAASCHYHRASHLEPSHRHLLPFSGMVEGVLVGVLRLGGHRFVKRHRLSPPGYSSDRQGAGRRT
ncbi:hypothetical protein Droror1_Dr00019908, partial [Drosera rotundifolia]